MHFPSSQACPTLKAHDGNFVVQCNFIFPIFNNTYSFVSSSLAPGLASLVFEAKSLPMASTNPMSNPPAVGAGYNAARKGSNGAAPGGTPSDAPADVPVDTPVDTPFDTAIVPAGQVEPSEVSSPIESPR